MVPKKIFLREEGNYGPGKRSGGAGKVLFSRIFQFRVPDNNTCKLWENLKIKLFDLYLNCDQGKRVAGSNLFNI